MAFHDFSLCHNLRIQRFKIGCSRLCSKQIERGEDENLIRYRNFKEFLNHTLIPNTSQILATIDVKDYINCAFACVANMACFSFNLAISPNFKTGPLACHLLAADKYNQSSSFVSSREFHHYTVAVS